MNWLQYLLEANIYLGVFYAAYCLFLTKETHYLLNRIYLVLSCVIAFVLPVLQLGILTTPPPPVAPAAFTAVPLQVIPVDNVIATPVVIEQHLTLQDGLWYIYLAGAVIFLMLFIIKLGSLLKLVVGKPLLKHRDYNLVKINDTNTAFSFFNYLFIADNTIDKSIIVRHELVHIRQKHSLDIIFLEVLKIINWFNPLIYLVQNSLKTVHEYIADEQSMDNPEDALAYSSFLVNNAYGLTGPSIAHSFFTYNLLKKRIIMLNQQRSGNLARLKYLVTVPIGAALLCASTMGFSKTYGWIDIAPRHSEKFNAKPASISEASAAIVNNPYDGLAEYVTKNMRYKLEYAGKTGFVLVDYILTNNHKLNDIVVRKTVPEIGVRGQLYKLFGSYQEAINDNPGHHTLAVVFNSGDDHLSISPAIKKLPGYAGELTIQAPPPPPTAPKNYKTGKAEFFSPPPPPQSPKKKTYVVKFPPPIVFPDVPNRYADLHNYLATIIYPKNAENVSVVVAFNINDNHKISDAKLIKSSGKDFNKLALSALNALKAYTGVVADNPGEHILSINFYNISTRPVVDREFKNDSKYSGEIFIQLQNGKSNSKVGQIKFPPPIVRPDKGTSLKPKTDEAKFPMVTISVPSVFYKSLQEEIHYPANARSNNNSRDRILTSFTIAGNKIKDIKVLNGTNGSMIAEIKRALSGLALPENMSDGYYTLMVTFAKGTEKEYPRDAESWNKYEYTNRYKTQSVDAVPLNNITIVGYI